MISYGARDPRMVFILKVLNLDGDLTGGDVSVGENKTGGDVTTGAGGVYTTVSSSSIHLNSSALL